MEELQDAIEDAQYVNAIATQEDGPRPVLPWDKPSPEQLVEWEGRKKGLGELDWTLSSPIGLFLFSSFVKEKHDDYIRINFCEEVLRFRKARGRARLEKSQLILQHYLSIDYEDKQPPRTEIDEYDLERPIPPSKLTKEENDKLMQMNMDYPQCTECTVGLKGPVRQEIFEKFKNISDLDRLVPKNISMREISGLTKSAPAALTSTDVKSLQEMAAVASPNVSQAFEPQDAGPDDDEKPRNSIKVLHQSAYSAPEGQEHRTPLGEEKEPMAHKRDPIRVVRKSSSTSTHEMHANMRSLTQRLRSSGNSSKQSIPETVFDDAERVVMLSLERQYWTEFLQSEHYLKLKNFLWYADRRVVPEDFFVMRVLGRGGFGLVTACKKGTSGKLYAMKVMNKRRIKMKKSEQLALNERKVLEAVESNFVVNLKYSFHSKDDVFLVLDLMTGGDLGYHLHIKKCFPKKECQYYAARIMLGLQALHDKQYVYRDLKPENCLLAEDGRVKITDLGLATKITPTLHGAAGTRGYWAPEMLRRDKKGKRMPYGHTVDWFSFGCCVAEFISGSNPFRSEAALNFGLERGKQTKEKAIDCATLEMEPEFNPEKFEPDAADLCRRLLDKNERTRLGASGCEEIMAHPWFKNVNWEKIISDRTRPPYVPPKDVNAASQSEIGTFAEDKAYQETVITEADDEIYKDWDWLNPHAFAAEVIEFLIYERETGEPLVPVTQNTACCCQIL